MTTPSDVLYGAHEIALFLFGDTKYRRRVYALVSKRVLPVFRMGAIICARRSALGEWLKRQEANAAGHSPA
jgi:hypothetical protein